MLDHPSTLEAEARARRADRLVRSRQPRMPSRCRRPVVEQRGAGVETTLPQEYDAQVPIETPSRQ